MRKSYSEYLASPAWKKMRAKILKRDHGLCRGCGKKAHEVHHRRYPKKLGEEKSEWLFSVCVPCHAAIHKAALKMTLRAATDLILGATREGNVVYLPDAGPPPGNRARWTKKPSRTPKKKKLQPVPNRELRRKKKIDEENDRLHAIFKANRERRERRAR